jgi:hypothetical protein
MPQYLLFIVILSCICLVSCTTIFDRLHALLPGQGRDREQWPPKNKDFNSLNDQYQSLIPQNYVPSQPLSIRNEFLVQAIHLTKEIVYQAYTAVVYAVLFHFVARTIIQSFENVYKQLKESDKSFPLEKSPHNIARYLKPNVTLTEDEQFILQQAVLAPEAITEDWSNLGGVHHIKKSLISSFPMHSSNSTGNVTVGGTALSQPCKSALFYGPPGNGILLI